MVEGIVEDVVAGVVYATDNQGGAEEEWDWVESHEPVMGIYPVSLDSYGEQ